ncbi:hypothetical protein HPG69_007191, partial [Diceros bicornis minor]
VYTRRSSWCSLGQRRWRGYSWVSRTPGGAQDHHGSHTTINSVFLPRSRSRWWLMAAFLSGSRASSPY